MDYCRRSGLVIGCADPQRQQRSDCMIAALWQSGWNVPLWPARASTHAGKVDAVFIFLLILCGAMAFLISLMITVFAIKFRRSAGRAAEQIEGNNTLEITWSVVPLFIFMVIFVWGASVYYEGSRPPKNSEEV